MTTCKGLTFESQGYRLKGTLHLPDTDRPPVVIGSHGLHGTAGSAKQVVLAEACAAAGIGYLRFDHRGCGRSSGDFARATTLDGRAADILAAAAVIVDRVDTAGALGLFGSSLGGAACIRAAGSLEAAALVVCAAPVRSVDIDTSRAVPPDTENQAVISRPAGLRFDLAGSLDGLQEILLFHGEADEVVPCRHAAEIYAAASQPKKLIALPGGDHRMTDSAHQKLFVAETLRWFKERLTASRK